MKKTLVILLLIISTKGGLIYAGAFDYVGLGARAQGMGDAFTAVADDLSSVIYNPAGLSHITENEVFVSYRDFYNLGLLTESHIGLSIPNNNWNVCFSYHRIGTTDRIKFTNYSENTYYFTVATSLFGVENFYGGWNFKYHSVISENKASGYGLDGGLLYKFVEQNINLGLTVSDITGTNIRWDTQTTDNIPLTFRVGASYNILKNMVASLDYLSNGKINFGTELWLFESQILGLRTGASNVFSDKNVLCLGVSLSFTGIQIDYAINKHYSLDFTHYLSLHLRI